MLRTYDAASEFVSDPKENAGDGTWSYGYFLGGNPRTISLYNRLDTPEGREGILRWSCSHVRGFEPNVTFNQNGAQRDVWPARGLALHPGRLQQRSAIIWHTPYADANEAHSSKPDEPLGDVLIMGAFTGLDRSPTTHVWIHHLQGPGSPQPDRLIFSGYVESFQSCVVFYRCAKIYPGDQLVFSVGTGRDGDYAADTTGLQAIITPVTWK